MSDPAASTLQRLLPAARGLALLAVALAVGQHAAAALAAAGGLDAPALAWAWSVAHLVLALVGVPLGAQLLSRLYPLRGLESAPNDAAVLQATAHRLAAAAVAAAAWGGADAASLGVSAAFWALGIAAVALIAAGHRLVTRYRDHEEIAAGNAAAALASAGLHLAIAIVVSRAILGQFTSWSESLTGFAIALAWVLALWPLRQLVLARGILGLAPKAMDTAVAGERDLGVAAAEALCYVVAALGLTAWA
jgi:uncharacterized membrane protein YjfL (UPF0719 family)